MGSKVNSSKRNSPEATLSNASLGTLNRSSELEQPGGLKSGGVKSEPSDRIPSLETLKSASHSETLKSSNPNANEIPRMAWSKSSNQHVSPFDRQNNFEEKFRLAYGNTFGEESER